MTNLKQKRFVDTDYLKEQLDSTAIEVEGSHITATETKIGAIQDLEILGNTVQDPNNLADIKSVGELQEDGTYKMSILSCGKNFNSGLELGGLNTTTGDISVDNTKFRSKNYIKIKPNMDINIKMYTQDLVVNSIFEYDANLKFIKNISPGTALSSNCAYIKVQGRHTTNGTDITSILNNNVALQIEEGTVATPYEPYQENKCDILLPCQLEKVGDVSDRLYYDDVEKAWCIEKNIETIVLNGSETWLRFASWDTTNTMAFYLDYNAYKVYNKDIAKKGYTECKSNLFNYSTREDFVDLIDKEKIVMYGRHAEPFTCSPQISILKSKLPTQDVIGFKTWLSENPTLVKYQLATPQKIVLPLDTQIALNSFFGTTHIYMESGEVEGTIKCKIPKSLGATVQSLNNKTDILSNRIESIEGLKDSQNMKYETDKGYLVCKETKNGVIDDLKIEGKTLVNVLRLGGNWFEQETTLQTDSTNNIGLSDYRNSLDLSLLKNNTVYTVIPFVDYTVIKKGMIYVQLNTEINGTLYGLFRITEDMFNKPTLITTSELTNKNIKSLFIGGANCEYKFKNVKILVLEGDHTQNPPSYFEGLMSVGQDVDKIEVLSRKEDGNLFDEKEFVKYINNCNPSAKQFTENNKRVIQFDNVLTHDKPFMRNNFKPNTKYTFSMECKNTTGSNVYLACLYTDGTMGIIGNTSSTTYTTIQGSSDASKTIEYMYISYGLGGGCAVVLDNFSVKQGTSTTYEPLKQDKKQILYYNSNGELEPIQELHEWDSIEKHSDNKWYYHKRSGEVVLNGSESGWNTNTQTDTTMRFEINMVSKNMAGNRNPIICDKFNLLFNYELNCVEEGVFTSIKGSTLFLNILKSKLSTQDVQGFKQWLQTNNVTVVYQLAQEEVYECIDLGVNSYEGETLVQVNSGVICPQNLAFSTQKHIGNIVNKLQERVDKNTKFREELTENMTYTETIEQGKGYTVIENSKEGVVTVPEIKGKTLVNLFVNGTFNDNGSRLLQVNTNTNMKGVITFVPCLNGRKVIVDINKISDGSWVRVVNCTEPTLITLAEDEYIKQVYSQYSDGWSASDSASYKKHIILEGDYTQNPPSYFEGLMSVGEDIDKIEVSSVNENLFTYINTPAKMGGGDSNSVITNLVKTDTGFSATSSKERYGIEYAFISKTEGYIYVKTEGNINSYISIWNSSKGTSQPCTTISTNYVKFPCKNGELFQIGIRCTATGVFSVENIYVAYSEIETNKCSLLDKKQILFYNTETQTWEKPVLREWDSIEKHTDGKYYYHQRSAEVVLNGSAIWTISTVNENTLQFVRSLSNVMSNSILICDKFKYNGDGSDTERVNYTSSLYLNVLKSKLSTQDVEGFKQWLQANNVTVVYQLAEEKVYECTNIDLNSYNGETNVIVESGAIVPQTTVKIQNNLQEIIRNLKNRVRQLEEEVYNYKVNQNLRQLRTFYKSDYANFGVATLNNYSIEPTSIAITPYGYDLFEIFKEVIAQGKDKYDRIELEEYIDFYLMTFVFDFDMVFELFDLLDANEDIIEDEPVEEEPPTEEEEDVVEDTPTILPNLPEDEATPIPLI